MSRAFGPAAARRPDISPEAGLIGTGIEDFAVDGAVYIDSVAIFDAVDWTACGSGSVEAVSAAVCGPLFPLAVAGSSAASDTALVARCLPLLMGETLADRTDAGPLTLGNDLIAAVRLPPLKATVRAGSGTPLFLDTVEDEV